ncbi:MAG: hypothetical protein JW934_17720 [Anaerolineae bacterium]|nr:hypothetical protein [Anaerolineae bacterium]
MHLEERPNRLTPEPLETILRVLLILNGHCKNIWNIVESSSMKRFVWIWAFILVGMWVSACRLGVGRGDDGALQITTSLTEEKLQSQLAAAIADPSTQNLTIDLREGYALISGERKRDNSDTVDTLSFHLTLGVQDGHLTAAISDTQINGKGVQGDAVDAWAERIVSWLEQIGKNNANSSLQSVSIGDDKITMVWRVEKKDN